MSQKIIIPDVLKISINSETTVKLVNHIFSNATFNNEINYYIPARANDVQ